MAGGKHAKILKQAKLGDDFKKNKNNKLDDNNTENNSGSSNNDDSTINAETDRGLKRKMDESLQEFNTTIQKMESEIFELRFLYEKSQGEIQTLKDSNVILADRLSEEQYKTSVLTAKVNDLEQYQRRPSIRVFGFPDAEDESAETSEELVVNVIDKKLGIKLQSSQIQVAHRAGKFTPGAKRGILMQFVNKKDKAKVMKKRKQLKSSGISIAEDLTPFNVRRLEQLKQLHCVSEAWSHQGKLFAKGTERPQIVKEIPSIMTIDECIFTKTRAQAPQKANTAVRPPPEAANHAGHIPEQQHNSSNNDRRDRREATGGPKATSTSQQQNQQKKQASSQSKSDTAPSKANARHSETLRGAHPDSESNAMDETFVSGPPKPKSSSTPKLGNS